MFIRVFSILKKTTHYNRGIWAEYYASAFLLIKGYRILYVRYKTKVGEVDIIAKKGKVLVFIEVKYRVNLETALSAVLPTAQKRIRRAAEHFLISKKAKESLNLDTQIRFDVIGITKNNKIRHIHNAF